MPRSTNRDTSLWSDWPLLRRALWDALIKFDPREQAKNFVMFIVLLGAVYVSALLLAGAFSWFNLQIALWLWFTVYFANFAEALAEGRGKAHADTLRQMRTQTTARKLVGKKEILVASSGLTVGDLFLCEAGDTLPADGEVVEGIATVDESAITGESAPVIRESGGDRSAVTGGTRVISDRIVVRVTAEPGKSFLDRMISLIEGARRQKTPNEIALGIVLVSLTLLFFAGVFTLPAFALYGEQAAQAPGSAKLTAPILIALLVCLIPTTIGGLLSAIGIGGIDRLMRRNVLALSGRAVEAAGDVDVLLLDKTGTITLGNRQAVDFLPAPGVSDQDLADVAQLASLADETPEGRSIVVLAKERYHLRGRDVAEPHAHFVPFSALTRMSGVDFLDSTGKVTRKIRKGAAEAIRYEVEQNNGLYPAAVAAAADQIARSGGTPIVVAQDDQIVGVVHLKDVVKGGIKERFAQLRKMGIRTVMVTGDNPLTAAAIAAEAGVDDFMANAKPEAKLERIRQEQSGGRLVAMTGDGTNDAPALAQADVGVAMHSGTQAAREAGNMVDLDSNPTKLLEIVEIGKQILMTRGSLTTFSFANDVAKYFAILPAMFGSLYALAGGAGPLAALNVMHLHSPESAILSAIVFNALIIVALIPLSLRGVKYRPLGAAALLRLNMLVYGLGGIIAPFFGIKIIDVLLVWLHAV
ncbi:MAG: potassium-transporting ATPase subunit KdpB [Candidatus Firestonebacteria bacterium]|nr:potassium-transporting ATPase subunit KdpB [Candidatus Firestonebacteria bacterium]